MEIIPNQWVVVKIKTKSDTSYHVLSSWGGSSGFGPSWKLSSMIKVIEKYSDLEFIVTTESGSVYYLDTLNQEQSITIATVFEQIRKNKKNMKCSIVDISEPYEVMP